MTTYLRAASSDCLMRIAHAKPFVDWEFNIAQIFRRGLQGLPDNDGTQEWMENAVGICLGAVAEAAQPDQPVSEHRPVWTEGICGDGAAILKDGVMQPIEDVVAALNATSLAQPVPEGPTEDDMNDLADDLLGIVLPEGSGARLITRALELWGRPAIEPVPTSQED
jgi:hypothetical protein